MCCCLWQWSSIIKYLTILVEFSHELADLPSDLFHLKKAIDKANNFSRKSRIGDRLPRIVEKQAGASEQAGSNNRTAEAL